MSADPFIFPGEPPARRPQFVPLPLPDAGLARQMTINMARAYASLYPKGSVGIIALGVQHNQGMVAGSGGIPTFRYQNLSGEMRPAVALAMGAALMRVSRDAFMDMAIVAGLPIGEFMLHVNAIVQAGERAAQGGTPD